MVRRLALFGVALLAIAAPLHAQRGSDALRATVSDSLRAAFLGRTVSDAVTARGEPRSFQVVRVPIPGPVKGSTDLRFDLEPEPEFRIVGARSGHLTGYSTAKDLLVTLAVPAEARAGQRIAARAVFRSAKSEIEVPIEMHIAPIYRVAVDAPKQIDGLRPGQRFDLSATVRNDGNATDTIQLIQQLPESWNNGVRDTVFVLLPHEARMRTIRVTVPRQSGTGSFFVHSTAVSHGRSATALTTLAVGNNPIDERPPGITLQTSLGSVAVEQDRSATVAQIAVSGPLTSEVRVDGRLTTRPSVGTAAIRGLSRVGSYVSSPHLTAWTSTWRTTLGSTYGDFTDITGVNAGGSGASFEFDDHDRLLKARAARPSAGGTGSDGGSIFGLEVGRQLRFGQLSASASRLRAGGQFEQALSSVGLQLVSPRLFDTQLTSGLAYRDYTAGSGVGVLVNAQHHSRATDADLKIVHAAGGSDAFARAENEFYGNVVQTLSQRWNVAASFYNSTDANAAAQSIRSRSVGLSQQFLLNDRITLHADQRSTSFDADGDPFSFGNEQHHVGAGAIVRQFDIIFSSDLSLERLTRSVNTAVVQSSESGNAFSWHGSAARALSFGSFAIDATYAHNDANTGYVPEQLLLALRADRAQLPFGPRNLYLEGELGYSKWSGIRSMATLRAGASYALPYDMEIGASLERNPLFYTTSAHVPWVLALRVDKSVSMPRIITGTAAGTVFQDYNGNGKQDETEPGMPDVVLKRGGLRATSSQDGRYRFWEQGSGRITVDPASLPYGWIVNERTSGANIALVPVTRVEVVLQPGMAETMRNLDLTPAQVLARDSQGRTFTARRTAPTTAVFEALPAGNYQIEVDFSGMTEPLRIDGPAPRITVTRETTARVVVPVSGRPLRFRGQ